MIDKLHLRSSFADEAKAVPDVLRNLGLTVTTRQSNSHHEVFIGHRGKVTGENHVITICTKPKEVKSSATHIQINPSRFASVREVDQLLSTFSPLELLKTIRIDLNADITVPLEDVHGSVIVPRKKIYERYGRGHKLTGFYFGKEPEIICAYDRGAIERCSEVKTRIEVRLFREKVPYPRYSDLNRYLEFDPFAKIHFVQLADPRPDEPSWKAYDRLQTLKRNHGAHGAYRLMNHHGNFKRDCKSMLVKNQSIPNLLEIHKQKLQTFFGGTRL